MSTPRQRSHAGCWTCKQRRRKCDETKPQCRACTERGIVCEGYGTRLRWGSGVASRGHLVGAQEPLPEKVPQREKGRQRDLKRRRIGEHDSPNESSSALSRGESSTPPVFTPATSPGNSFTKGENEERLLNQFLSSGHLFLYSALTTESVGPPITARLCQSSEALFHACVAFQAYVSNEPEVDFFGYYSAALSLYRAEISASISNIAAHNSEAILYAGILMCTIGGESWSYHLEGMDKLLELRGGITSPPNTIPEVAHAIEVMGLMDLPIFLLGRQHPSRRIWRRYRCQDNRPGNDAADNIEPVSGLPRSLIDLLSDEPHRLPEKQLWLWTGCEGNLVQLQLWEAYRYAGMLHSRRARMEKAGNALSPPQDFQTGSASPGFYLPSESVLMGGLLNAIDSVHKSLHQQGTLGRAVMNSLLYPTFIAALEVKQNPNYHRWDSLVDMWFGEQVREDRLNSSEFAWNLIREMQQRARLGKPTSAENVALEWGVEVSLL